MLSTAFLSAILLPALALATKHHHKGTGTISGFPHPPIDTSAPYPLPNSTLPYYPTGTGTGVSSGFYNPTSAVNIPTVSFSYGVPAASSSSNASECAPPSTVTITTASVSTVTVTVPAGHTPYYPTTSVDESDSTLTSTITIGTISPTGTGATGTAVPTGNGTVVYDVGGLKRRAMGRWY